MISVNDLKNGLTLELDNGLWSVVEFLHVKPGKGAAFVRTKLKNVETGSVLEKTFRAGEKVAKAMLNRKEMQYLYKAGEEFVMMDMESYEQLQLTKDQVGDGVKYMKEDMIVQVLMHDTKIIGVDIPAHVELKVVDTPPALYKYCISLRLSIAFATFSPALNVFSKTLPVSTFFSFVLTNAAPLPGFTCKNSTTDQSPLSNSRVKPFFKSFTEIINTPFIVYILSYLH